MRTFYVICHHYSPSSWSMTRLLYSNPGSIFHSTSVQCHSTLSEMNYPLHITAWPLQAASFPLAVGLPQSCISFSLLPITLDSRRHSQSLAHNLDTSRYHEDCYIEADHELTTLCLYLTTSPGYCESDRIEEHILYEPSQLRIRQTTTGIKLHH